MQKPALLFLSFLLIILAASCKKERVCNCAITTGGFTTDSTINVGKTTLKNARNKCTYYQSSIEMMPSHAGAYVSCNL